MSSTTSTNTISINYDNIYETLVSGSCVWLYFSEDQVYEMIMAWAISSDGLHVTTYSGDYLFPNGSHNTSEGK